jgi:hypothetical protein
VGRCGLDSCGSEKRPVAGCCEHRNEHSGNFLTSSVTVSFARLIRMRTGANVGCRVGGELTESSGHLLKG